MKYLLLLFPLTAYSFTEQPNKLFSTDNNLNNSNITWITSTNVQSDCNKESKRRGLNGFSFEVEACSFWSNNSFYNSCTIITSKSTTIATLGHEIRHCFQGNWHN